MDTTTEIITKTNRQCRWNLKNAFKIKIAMERSIAAILGKNSNEISVEDLIFCAEIVRGNGDVFLIKFDGARDKNQYTTVITFPSGMAEMIRADEASLNTAFMKILREYVEIRK